MCPTCEEWGKLLTLFMFSLAPNQLWQAPWQFDHSHSSSKKPCSTWQQWLFWPFCQSLSSTRERVSDVSLPLLLGKATCFRISVFKYHSQHQPIHPFISSRLCSHHEQTRRCWRACYVPGKLVHQYLFRHPWEYSLVTANIKLSGIQLCI